MAGVVRYGAFRRVLPRTWTGKFRGNPPQPDLLTFAALVNSLAPAVYLRLDEPSGTMMADSSGWGRGGTHTGVTLAAAGSVTGDTDTAATYGGTSSNHSDVLFGSWMNPTTQAITFMAAVKYTSAAAGPFFFFSRDGNTALNQGLYYASGKINFLVRTSAGSVSALGATNFNDGNYHLAIGTFTVANGIQVYVDGVLDGTAAQTGTLNTNSNNLQVGGRGASYAAATVDECATWPGVELTAGQVASLYAAWHGSVPATGAGAGTWTFVGTAAGTRQPKGSGAGTLATVGTASGTRTSIGTGTGTFAFVGTAAGKRVPKASGTGSWTFTGTAAGVSTPKGTGAGSWAWVGTASGQRASRGVGTGTWTFVGAAAGKRTPKASAAGNFTFSGAAAGTTVRGGTGAGTWTWSGAATGSAPGIGASEGTGAGTWTFAGSAAGKRVPKATSTGTFTFAGAAAGKRTPKASSSGVYAYVGTAAGVTSRSGVSAGTWAWLGTAAGITPAIGLETPPRILSARVHIPDAAGTPRVPVTYARIRTAAATGDLRPDIATQPTPRVPQATGVAR